MPSLEQARRDHIGWYWGGRRNDEPGVHEVRTVFVICVECAKNKGPLYELTGTAQFCGVAFDKHYLVLLSEEPCDVHAGSQK